jgi:hypothetical protein
MIIGNDFKAFLISINLKLDVALYKKIRYIIKELNSRVGIYAGRFEIAIQEICEFKSIS